jgi:glycosyltransferase involved in cell wall biosynthesis
MASKMAFFRIWSQPPISSSVARLLREHFPEYDLEIFELGEIVRSRLDIVLINLLHVFWLYGVGILSGRRELKACFWRTPYIFKRIRVLVSEMFPVEEYAFSFQLYSICDAHVDGLPHYLYMDHTHLENLNYPGFDRKLLYAPSWIELERSIYRNATRIFTRSSNIARSLVEQYDCPPEKVAIVYVGSNFQSLEGEPENEGYANKNILFVGLDWERKGGPELVRAFRDVLEVHPDARLTIVGCTPAIDVPNSDIVGRAPVEQMAEYFRRASVFCLPTRREPFGVVFIEAFSQKIPVVATRVGAIPDFVVDGETGYLVPVGDADSLAEALTTLIADPSKCRAFGMAGYRLVKKRYNWENVGRSIRKRILASM